MVKKIKRQYEYEYIIYNIFLLIRFAFIFSFGYIHPDEFFQSSSITSHDILKINSSFITWEFSLNYESIRNILIPYIFTGIPFLIIKWLSNDTIYRWLMLIGPRLLIFSLSIGIDSWMKYICHTETKKRKKNNERTRMIFGSLWCVMIYHQRSFSNTIECFMVCFMFMVMCKWEKNEFVRNVLLGFGCSFGFFTRFTFLFFVFPIVLYSIVNFKSIKVSLLNFIDFTSAFLTVFGIMIYIDTKYYCTIPDIWTITPINNLLYNLKTENLAEHTLHPRYLHLLVNFPMLFLPLIVFIIFNCKKLFNIFRLPKMVVLSIFSIISGLGFLSIAPHQELRFIIPICIPVVIIFMFVSMGLSSKKFCMFVIISTLFSFIFVLFFGVFHQSGVIYSLLKNKNENEILIYYKTYMPPRYLSHKNEVVDFGRVENIVESIGELLEKDLTTHIYYPSSIDLPKILMENSVFNESFFPHLSTEDFPRSFNDLNLIKRTFINKF